MIKVNQKRIHGNGILGDCWRACITSIIECDIDLLPDYNDEKVWSKYYVLMFEKLEELGWRLQQFNVAEMFRYQEFNLSDTDGFMIAVGKSPRAKNSRVMNHAVVWKNGIVHDPHPQKLGILDIQEFDVLTKIKK